MIPISSPANGRSIMKARALINQLMGFFLEGEAPYFIKLRTIEKVRNIS